MLTGTEVASQEIDLEGEHADLILTAQTLAETSCEDMNEESIAQIAELANTVLFHANRCLSALVD